MFLPAAEYIKMYLGKFLIKSRLEQISIFFLFLAFALALSTSDSDNHFKNFDQVNLKWKHQGYKSLKFQAFIRFFFFSLYSFQIIRVCLFRRIPKGQTKSRSSPDRVRRGRREGSKGNLNFWRRFIYQMY